MRSPSLIVETPPAQEPLQVLVSEELQKLPPGVHVDLGPSLPAFYEVNRLVLMVQDPFHVFAYWEITESLKGHALARFPEEDRPGFQLLLDWCQLDDGQRITFDLGTVTCWWLKTNPGFHYQARLCFYSELYGTTALLESNIVETPKYSIKPSDSPATEDQDATNWLNHLLELTSVAKMKPVNDSTLVEAGPPVSQPATLKELEDRPPAVGQSRRNSPENSSGEIGPLSNSWPTS
jgi:hypothetical protein